MNYFDEVGCVNFCKQQLFCFVVAAIIYLCTCNYTVVALCFLCNLYLFHLFRLLRPCFCCSSIIVFSCKVIGTYKMGILKPFYKGCFAVDMTNLAVTALRFFGWMINKLTVVVSM